MMKRKHPLLSLLLFLTAGLMAASLVFLTGPLSLSDEGTADLAQKEEERIVVQLRSRPSQIHPGGSGLILIKIKTARGIKLTKYPQTSVTISGDEELIFEKDTIKLGQSKLPEDLHMNFLKRIPPLKFKFKVDGGVHKDRLHGTAHISYFYCMDKKGFCAPGTKNIDFQIPIKIRK